MIMAWAMCLCRIDGPKCLGRWVLHGYLRAMGRITQEGIVLRAESTLYRYTHYGHWTDSVRLVSEARRLYFLRN